MDNSEWLVLYSISRRRVYRAVEEVVNNPFITNRRERVGVPQHFGIYYAIGEGENQQDMAM